jgi:hypothetical protein
VEVKDLLYDRGKSLCRVESNIPAGHLDKMTSYSETELSFHNQVFLERGEPWISTLQSQWVLATPAGRFLETLGGFECSGLFTTLILKIGAICEQLTLPPRIVN